MNKNILIVVVIVVLGIIGWFMLNKKPVNTDIPKQTSSQVTIQTTEQVNTQTGNTIKEFTVVGVNFSYSPSTITVKKGDIVKITFKDDDGFHDLKVDGYGVTERVNTGGESSITFITDKAGTFDYYCTVGTHREKGMAGKFVVEN